MGNGLFVAFDGLDGTGKSKLIEGVVKRLVEENIRVKSTKEPSYGPIGKFIREHDFCGMTLACLVVADRMHHIEFEIKPFMNEDYVVISDRYVASSYVCQQLDGINIKSIENLNSKIIKPDAYIFLKANKEIIAKRLAERKLLSRMEKNYSYDKTAKLLNSTIERFENKGYENIIVLDSNTENDYYNNLDTIEKLIVKLMKKKGVQ